MYESRRTENECTVDVACNVRGSNACSFILTDILNTGIETCMGVKIAQDESRQDGIRES